MATYVLERFMEDAGEHEPLGSFKTIREALRAKHELEGMGFYGLRIVDDGGACALFNV